MNLSELLSYFDWINQIAGGVWGFLSILMIVTILRLRKMGKVTRPAMQTGIVLLIFVWLYPLYTLSFQSMILGEAGNILTLMLTVFYARRVKQISRPLARLMIPQMIWLSMACVYLGLQIWVAN